MKLFKKTFAFLLSAVMLLGASLPAAAAETTPFKDHKLPGNIRFADFDIGEVGVTHGRRQGAENGDYPYRDDANLNFWNFDGPGVIIGSVAPTFFVYTVKATRDGIYNVYSRTAGPNNTYFTLVVDDEVLFEKAVAWKSGDWNAYKESKLGSVYIPSGTHVIRMEQYTNSANLWDFRFEYVGPKSDIDLTPTEGNYRKLYLPTKIEAEDYDIDNNYSINGKNDLGEYREADPMDITTTTGGYALQGEKGEYVTYTLQVDKAGPYALSAQPVSNSQITVSIDDVEVVTGAVVEPANPETQNLINVYLTEGTHKMKVSFDGKIVMDSFKFLETDEEYINLEDVGKEVIEEEVTINAIYKNIYVAPNGSDENAGTKESPFATLERAAEEVTKYNKEMTGDIVVHFAGGDYPVKEKMVLTEAISGYNGHNVIFKGDDLMNPPVFNAGTKITGWQPQEGSPIWVAPADHIEDTRTLYVNEFPATLAKSRYRYKGSGYFKDPGSSWNTDGMTVSATNFPVIEHNIQDVVLGWPVLWTLGRTPLDSISYEGKDVKLYIQQPNWDCYSTTGPSHLIYNTAVEFFVENAIELLDEPGEFYFDRVSKKIYYYPYAEEDLTTAETWVGTTEMMMDFSGSSLSSKLKNVELNNLTFKYSAYNKITDKGMRVNQTDSLFEPLPDGSYYIEEMFPAQITMLYADNITIRNCDFACLGSNAINMIAGVRNTKVIGNLFRDVSGTAVMVGHFLHGRNLGNPDERVGYVEVADNVVRRAGWEFSGSAAIAAYYATAVNIHHNDIKDVPYTGITLGWGWGANVAECRDHNIKYNRIENVTHIAKDGAHVYTLGDMPNTFISNNYMIDAGDFRGGIYHDSGSANMVLENNVIRQSDCALFVRSGALIHDITARNNYTDSPKDRFEDQNGVGTEINTVVVKDGNWPAEAQKIMAEAGVRPQYTGLIKKSEYPEWRVQAFERYPLKQFASKYIYDVNRWVECKEYTDAYDINADAPEIYVDGTIGNTRPGEWVEWTINVPEAGTYRLDVRSADGWEGNAAACTVKLSLDGEVLVDGFTVPRGGWAVKDVYIGEFYLEAGEHTFRHEVQGNDSIIGGFKFDNGQRLPDALDYNDPEMFTQAQLNDWFADDGFTDIIDHWAYYDIISCVGYGIVKGYNAKTFGPDDNVTLYQACMMTQRFLGNTDDSEWKENSLAMGMLKSADEPDGPVSRERFADIMMKAWISEMGPFKITVGATYFTDADSISEEYRYSAFGAKEYKIINGYPDGSFKPNNTLTRAEAVTTLMALGVALPD